MGLFRLLFWIILIAAAFWLWRRVMRKGSNKQAAQTTLPMVRCAQCGVHVPRAQALQNEDRWYCSRAHLEQDSQPGGH
ncbi:PP0621 family protein [Stutzerimonas nitrititolerans]|uniref:PP0621 family protein n=1 Tax=Stutzerimonas nitrititolerans TaxID=2482751 RepID=UPI00289E6C27|nr:PP0621 family protein [Stutzerimonas nitrititolerans]